MSVLRVAVAIKIAPSRAILIRFVSSVPYTNSMYKSATILCLACSCFLPAGVLYSSSGGSGVLSSCATAFPSPWYHSAGTTLR